MRCELNEMKGDITKYYFYQTLSDHHLNTRLLFKWWMNARKSSLFRCFGYSDGRCSQLFRSTDSTLYKLMLTLIQERSCSFEPGDHTDQIGESLPVQGREHYAKGVQCLRIIY